MVAIDKPRPQGNIILGNTILMQVTVVYILEYTVSRTW